MENSIVGKKFEARVSFDDSVGKVLKVKVIDKIKKRDAMFQGIVLIDFYLVEIIENDIRFGKITTIKPDDLISSI